MPIHAASVRLKAAFRETVDDSAAALTSVKCHGVVLKAICPGQTIYIGADATVSAANGYPMSDGETLSLEVFDVAEIWAIASAADQHLAVLPYARH